MKTASRLVPFVAIAASLVVMGAGDAPDPLVVLSDFANPPFSSWKEGEAEPQGLEPDIMREVGRALGRPMQWHKRPFAELLQAVAAGEGDVIAATLGITAERAKIVAYSQPYYDTQIAVVVGTDAGAPKSLADLDGKRVGASRGTTSEAAVLRSLPKAIAVLDREEELAFDAMLLAGRIDAAVMDAPAADRLVSEHPEALRRLEQDLGAERYAFAVSKDDAQLVAAIDRVLAGLEQDGRLRAWKQRHGVAP